VGIDFSQHLLLCEGSLATSGKEKSPTAATMRLAVWVTQITSFADRYIPPKSPFKIPIPAFGALAGAGYPQTYPEAGRDLEEVPS